MSNDIVKDAHEWADGEGFPIVSDRFEGCEADGGYVLRSDPRDILVDAYIALVGRNTP